MTEAEWLACEDPDPMLGHLQGKWHERLRSLIGLRPFPLSKRKLRLFYCGCSRRLMPEINGTSLEKAVTAAEKYADRLLDIEKLRTAQQSVLQSPSSVTGFLAWRACDSALRLEDLLRWQTVLHAALISYVMETEEDRENQHTFTWIRNFEIPVRIADPLNHTRCEQARLVRDIFGNPFRSVTLKSAWHTGPVTQLAEGAYADGAFDRLPIIADALEETGCASPLVLDHLRSPGPHVRGCWVIDLLTGRQ